MGVGLLTRGVMGVGWGVTDNRSNGGGGDCKCAVKGGCGQPGKTGQVYWGGGCRGYSATGTGL